MSAKRIPPNLVAETNATMLAGCLCTFHDAVSDNLQVTTVCVHHATGKVFVPANHPALDSILEDIRKNTR